ncbi:transposable element Tc1 transposase [Trichonephila clavipes]|nr:transposable element Tc1 transposase [Trichonephila clavipes]
MAVNDRTAFSRQLAARWCTATSVLMSASSILRRLLCRGLCARVPLYRIPLTAKHRRLRLQWAHEHRAWQADWYQVVFSDESRFNLWDHDGRIRVRRYAGERCLPECVIERHSGLTAKVIVWGAISYPGRSNLLRIESNLNSNRYVREVLQPEVIPFLQCIPGAIFQKDNAGPHVGKTVRNFCSAQHVQFLPWPTYSLDMSPVEHVWDLVDSGDLVDSLDLIAGDLRPAGSKDEILLRIQAIWNSLLRADIQNMFDSNVDFLKS